MGNLKSKSLSRKKTPPPPPPRPPKPKLEYTPLVWPKKNDDWDSLVDRVDAFVLTYDHSDTPQKTIVELNIGVYQICKEMLRRRNPPQVVPKRCRLLESLVQKLYTKKCSPRPACPTRLLANHFQSLNLGKKEVELAPAVANPVWNNFDVSQFSIEHFKLTLETKRNNRSNFDGLCYELVRRSGRLAEKLLYLFNQIFKTGKLPDIWYHGLAYGVYKGAGATNVAKHFRPIVRMDTFSKLYWHIVVQRLRDHMSRHNILNRQIQKAYQVGTRGVEESLFIHQTVKPHCKLAVYLDIKNAFGSLQPSFVKLTLKTYGVPDFVVDSIVGFLEKRTVWVGDESRKWDTGVPQGAVLSNFLFILCMNYILDYIQDKYGNKFGVSVHNSKFLIQAFADDIVIYGESAATVQIVLDELASLLKMAHLDLQVKKCLVDYLDKDSPKVFLDGMEIPNVLTKPGFKYLGQYARCTDPWKQMAAELKHSLDQIKKSFEANLPNPKPKDYWYAYQTIWRHRIAWFMRVNDATPEKAKLIETVEIDWFRKIPGLVSRLMNKDFTERQENALIIRHTALDHSNDARVSTLYRQTMGDRYEKVKLMWKNKPGVSHNSGFKKSFYV
jgi:hypothetical protein